MQTTRRPLFALAAALAIGAAAHAQTYSVVDIGKLPGTDWSYPTAINSKNTANVKVVGTTVIGGYKNSPYYWSSSTGIVRIGLLGTGTYGEALDVNRLGETVGHSATRNNANSHAFYWSPQRGPDNPLDLSPNWQVSHAYNITEEGVVFGNVYRSDLGQLPAVWVPISPGSYGDPILLPLPAGTPATSSGPGMGRFFNANRDIAFALPTAAGTYPFLWRNVGTVSNPVYGLPEALPVPAGASGGNVFLHNNAGQAAGWDLIYSYGVGAATSVGNLSAEGTQLWGLNDNGVGAGHGAVTVKGSTQLRAVVYLPTADPAHGLVAGLNNLGTLGGTQSRAYGANFNGLGFSVNNQDQVVGWSLIKSDRETHAFLWDRTNKMRDLNSVGLTPNKGAFSYLIDAVGITDEGFIVGRGYTTRRSTQTFLLVPN